MLIARFLLQMDEFKLLNVKVMSLLLGFWSSTGAVSSKAQVPLFNLSLYPIESVAHCPVLCDKSLIYGNKIDQPAVTTSNLFSFRPNSKNDTSSINDFLTQLHLGMGFQQVVRFRPLDYPYKLNQLGQFNLGLNYWHGYLKINLSFAALEKQGAFPDCRMLDYALAYEYHHKIYKELSLFVAPQMGYNTIQFEYSDYSPGRLIETETSAAISLGMQQVWRNRLGISLVYRRYLVMASPRNVFSTIDLGVSCFFRPNKKLQKWLS